MKRIIILVPFLFGKGGTETVLKSVISNDPEKYFLYLIVRSSDSRWVSETSLQKEYYFAGNPKDSKLKRYVRLAFFLTNEKPKIVIALDTKLILFLNYIRKIFRLHFKIVSWIHYTLFNNPIVNLKWLKYADFHLAIADGIKDQLIKLGVPKEKIFTIYNPIVKKNKTIEGSDTSVSKYIYIGRIQYNGQKNIHDLLVALSKLNFKWQIDFFGTGTKDDILKCKVLGEKLKINSSIRWHGFVKNPFKIIQFADALLLSSNFEGLPMVLLEAMSYGIPCISSNCDVGPSEIVKNNINGYLYEKGNISDFVEKLNIFHKYGVRSSRSKIKATISQFYEGNYFKNFNAILKELNKLSNF